MFGVRGQLFRDSQAVVGLRGLTYGGNFRTNTNLDDEKKMNDAGPIIKFEKRGSVAEIRFNRPKHLNSLNIKVSESFAEAVGRIAGDPSIRVIVLSGEGRSFMAGGDLAMFHAADDKPAAARALIGNINLSLKQLASMPQISIARIQGAVAGAGVSFALAADLAIASDDATFSLAYAKIGASPDCGVSWELPRIVGTRRAMEIALLPDTITAEESLRLGLVNKVVPRARLDDEIAALADRLANGPSVAYGNIKRLIRGSYEHTYSEQLDREKESFAQCAGTDDFAGAVDAFFSKTKHEFQGS